MATYRLSDFIVILAPCFMNVAVYTTLFVWVLKNNNGQVFTASEYSGDEIAERIE